MNNEQGFLGLISDKNKFFPFLLDDERNGQLGFAVLNDFFSEKLFPGISTLMPNLVYCYLIFGLTWNKGLSTDVDINKKLGEITTWKSDNGNMFDKNKGFHGEDVKENIVGTYRRFMERYGFFDVTEGSKFQKLNKGCTEQNRYKQIKGCIENLNNLKKDACRVGLAPKEQEDMINRCYQRLIMDEDYSLFDYVVSVFSDLAERSVIEKKDICLKGMIFEDMGKIFEIQKQIKTKTAFDNEKVDKLHKMYQAARFASIMEFYVKCRSNYLIRKDKNQLRLVRNKDSKMTENTDELLRRLSETLPKEKLSDKHLLEVIDNELCKEKMKYLYDIYSVLVEKEFMEHLADDKVRKLLENSEVGKSSVWNRKEITEYHDTFRWEYRPEDDIKNTRKAGNNTKCASYFVRELFPKD